MKGYRHYFKILLLVLSTSFSCAAAHAAISISDTPLFLSVSVTPNVIMTLDDSGSMAWGFVPDSISNTYNNLRFTAASFNGMYYNPKVTYSIPTRTDGVTYTTSFTTAYVNGFDKSRGSTNLSSSSYQPIYDCYPDYPISWCSKANSLHQPAYYSLYYTDKSGASKPSGCNDNVNNDSCYIRINVGSSADITSGNTAAQKQNFANWYSFYRSRALALMSSAMSSVTSLDTDQVRFAWQTLNNYGCDSFGTSCKDYADNTHENRMRTLDAVKTGATSTTHRTDFYNWLERPWMENSTPLRSALRRAGEYYRLSGLNSPYAKEPYTELGTELSCRKDFHILFTDGYWNSDTSIDFGGNIDNTAATMPDGTAYTPQSPYLDANSNSLSDIAFLYWKTDLRNLKDNVPAFFSDRSSTTSDQYWNPRNDPATWQHMVNFTIGLGLGNVLTDPAWAGSTYAGGYSALAAGTKSWPATSPDAVGNVYDLWHAAIDSRGQFFSADNPAAASQAFKSVFSSILSASSSASALTANSTSIQTGTLVYQATFSSTDWHGQLVAYSVNANGSIGAAQWDASTLVPAASSRNLFTWNGSTGKTFTNCNASLSAAQKLALDTNSVGTVDNLCSDRLAWLRGDTSKETRNGGSLRNRKTTVLGDIIHSDPIYVQNEDFGYATATGMSEASSYAAFVSAKSSRIPTVYVGANDGMLHAFRADVGNTASGKELFGYVPGSVYSQLSRLTDTNYSHAYYVDGSPSSGDAYWSGSWKSVLVGGLGAGGKSVYALDISNPDSFSASNVLWEFSDSADLGYTFSQPQIARLNNGEWAAIFGNGYNSASDKAFLYIVRLSDGTLIKKIAAGSGTGNGLSTPVLYDSNGDQVIDTIYAGDLMGNVWKFDVSGTTSASWGLTNGAAPLFTATNSSGQVQPITAQPAVGKHSSGGVLVYFGTGRYLTSTDPSNTDVQTFYAIWDNGTTGTVTRSQLQPQFITAETNEFGAILRETTDNSVDWTGGKRGWYMDLVVAPTTSAGPGGERIVSRPLIKFDRVVFSTMIPSTDQCVPGGDSWIMELNLMTGGRTTLSSFDLNNDNQFDDKDKLGSGAVASGIKSTVGITGTPTWLSGSSSTDIKELSGTSGAIMSLKNRKPQSSGTVTRIFWQQIQ